MEHYKISKSLNNSNLSKLVAKKLFNILPTEKSCISKIKNTSVEDLEDLDIFLSMYNL